MNTIPNQKPNTPFDDALPEKLLQQKTLVQNSRTVHVHKEAPRVLSPYVVKLTHESGEHLIVEDADIFPDEAVLVEYHNGELYFSEDEALAQILEDTSQVTEQPRIAPYPASRGYDTALPTAPLFLAEPQDIFATLFAESSDSEGETPFMASLEIANDVNEKVISSEKTETSEYTVLYADGQENRARALYEELPVQRIAMQQPRGWKMHLRATVAFATLAAVVLLPLQASSVFARAMQTKTQVTEQSTAGLSQFLRGANALQEQDFKAASALFDNASGTFASASDTLRTARGIVASALSLIPKTERTASTAQALVDIGEHVSRASNLLARGIEEASAAQTLSITDRLALISAYMEESLPEMRIAAEASTHIDETVLPEAMRGDVAHLVALLPNVAESFAEGVAYSDALGMILGSEGKRTYVLVFQNNNELRPTGGFAGSFAEVSFEKGAIVNMHIPDGGTYDVQGQLQTFVAAPGPLQLLRPRWEFQDANWFPDFPTSARKMLSFYESAGGPSADGVLAINASVLEKIIHALGGITLEDGTELTAENVVFLMQKDAEIDAKTQGRAPKTMVGEITQVLFDRLKNADVQTMLRVTNAFIGAFQNKDMQVYFSDNDLQATVQSLEWTGALRTTASDYLMVAHTNVGGGKTDGIITRDVTVDVALADDGTIENTVTLTQTHRGMVSALFTGINNVDYVRLYVPKGSAFITGSGFEPPSADAFPVAEYPLDIDADLAMAMQSVEKETITGTDVWEEGGKTVFGNWIQTAPGETQTVTFTYRLPWSGLSSAKTLSPVVAFAKQALGAREALSHAMVIQKQSGVTQNVLVRVHAPKTFTQIWSSEEKEVREKFIEQQSRDAFVGWIFEK